MPRFQTLADWLGWQEDLHPKKIDLGLERVAMVAGRLGILQLEQTVITVAGTNGKGSSVALLESILSAGGYRVGTYTSPHLFRYNERIRMNGHEVDDGALCDAFAAVDEARGTSSLSYFEFGTLAALQLFSQAPLDIVVLEVGLGGRLDAVNIIDASVALVTSIDIDHCAWLGTDRESIGAEKAGVFRSNRPAICSDPAPPASVEKHALQIGADWYCLGQAYDYEEAAGGWIWRGAGRTLEALPYPSLPGKHQLNNAAGVLMVLELLAGQHPVTRAAIEQGLQSVSLPGRCQVVAGLVEQIFDVAHNTDSASRLLQVLEDRPCSGSTRLVLGMLDDKQAGEFASCLAPAVDHWYLAGLDSERGLSARALLEQVENAGIRGEKRNFQDVHSAWRQAHRDSAAGDRIVVCGSFLTVAEALSSPV
ncbi:MAG: bifunctional tetrahydrofolate synthase/dihydrofolate synthase [Gammaproteobacteria bacterium]